MSRPELRPDDSPPDSIRILEQNFAAGFAPDLALDLVLNDLVVRAAEATHASAAALALLRNNEMVCRAATGHPAPNLGAPLKGRDGLSGACLETRLPQLSVDTEFDPRVDPDVSRRLGIRSILIVPVFDRNNRGKFAGVLEVFSTSAAAFSSADQNLLEDFAEECARIRQAALDLGKRKPSAAILPLTLSTVHAPELVLEPLPKNEEHVASAGVENRPYEVWTLALGALTILAAVAISLLIGSRMGLFDGPHPQSVPAQIAQTVAPAGQDAATGMATNQASPPSSESRSEKKVAAKTPAPAKKSTVERTAKQESQTASEGDLVIYEKGKEIFRMKPDSAGTPTKTVKSNDTIIQAASTARIADKAPKATVWLAPGEAETRLVSRTEPHYPPAAIAAHRSGDVILEVQVAEDGSVAKVQTKSGDPILATAAAEAVRSWHYQPYSQHDRPSRFQTDVTLSFNLPN